MIVHDQCVSTHLSVRSEVFDPFNFVAEPPGDRPHHVRVLGRVHNAVAQAQVRGHQEGQSVDHQNDAGHDVKVPGLGAF